MVKKRRSKKFSGILAKPIRELPEPKNPLLMIMDGESAALQEFRGQRASHIAREQIKRLSALTEHYGIKVGTRELEKVLLDLVLALVDDFDIPGFRVVSEHHRRGPKQIWGPVQQLNLLDCVAQERRRRKGSSARSACMRLIAPGARYSGYTFDTLYRYYQQAKKKHPDWVEITGSTYWDKIQRLRLNPKKQLSP